MKRALVALALLALPGCAHLVPWIHAHAAELAAVGLVAGTAAQLEQAAIGADELARRAAERRNER